MGQLRGTWVILPEFPPPGSTTGNAFGMSRASSSVAGVGLSSVGTQAQPWPSGKPAQPRRLRRTAFRIPAPQLLLTHYELPGRGAVGPSKSDSGDCNLERKKVCTCPRGAGGADTSQEYSGLRRSFQLAQCSGQSMPLGLHLRDLGLHVA